MQRYLLFIYLFIYFRLPLGMWSSWVRDQIELQLWPVPWLWHTRSFNPLCPARDWTFVLGLQRHGRSHCTAVGTPNTCLKIDPTLKTLKIQNRDHKTVCNIIFLNFALRPVKLWATGLRGWSTETENRSRLRIRRQRKQKEARRWQRDEGTRGEGQTAKPDLHRGAGAGDTATQRRSLARQCLPLWAPTRRLTTAPPLVKNNTPKPQNLTEKLTDSWGEIKHLQLGPSTKRDGLWRRLLVWGQRRNRWTRQRGHLSTGY